MQVRRKWLLNLVTSVCVRVSETAVKVNLDPLKQCTSFWSTTVAVKCLFEQTLRSRLSQNPVSASSFVIFVTFCIFKSKLSKGKLKSSKWNFLAYFRKGNISFASRSETTDNCPKFQVALSTMQRNVNFSSKTSFCFWSSRLTPLLHSAQKWVCFACQASIYLTVMDLFKAKYVILATQFIRTRRPWKRLIYGS